LREAVLSARTIGFSTGPSGVALQQLFERWGIAEVVRPRVVQAPPGVPVGTLITRGDVELGFQQLSELMHLEGIDVIGPMPPGWRSSPRSPAAYARPPRKPTPFGHCSTSSAHRLPTRPGGATACSRPETGLGNHSRNRP
jgi:hypothetical protein